MEPVDGHTDPLAALTARDLLVAMDEEIGRLPERYRLPLLLCCIEGLSQEDAAHRLGWAPGSGKAGLGRGRQRLQARFVRRGLTLTVAFATAGSRPGPAARRPAVLAA